MEVLESVDGLGFDPAGSGQSGQHQNLALLGVRSRQFVNREFSAGLGRRCTVQTDVNPDRFARFLPDDAANLIGGRSRGDDGATLAPEVFPGDKAPRPARLERRLGLADIGLKRRVARVPAPVEHQHGCCDDRDERQCDARGEHDHGDRTDRRAPTAVVAGKGAARRASHPPVETTERPPDADARCRCHNRNDGEQPTLVASELGQSHRRSHAVLPPCSERCEDHEGGGPHAEQDHPAVSGQPLASVTHDRREDSPCDDADEISDPETQSRDEPLVVDGAREHRGRHRESDEHQACERSAVVEMRPTLDPHSGSLPSSVARLASEFRSMRDLTA